MKYNVNEMISSEKIAKRVKEIASELNRDFEGQEVVFICILKGAAIFMADLIRHLEFDITTEYLEFASYEGEDAGKVVIKKDFDYDISGKTVVVIEDIIDTGGTLSYIKKHLEAKKPANIKYCVLLDNPVRRRADCQSMNPDYTGFTIPNQFVLGYGLDFNGKYRQLPFIAHLTKTN